jgi:hypothetical protein
MAEETERLGDEPRVNRDEPIAVLFDPGVVRSGRISSRDEAWLEVEFRPPSRNALVVGRRTLIAIGRDERGAPPDRSALVTARIESVASCRYRLFIGEGAAPVEHARAIVRSTMTFRPMRASLRFGQLQLEGELVAATDDGLHIEVTAATEARLRSVDALEVVLHAAEDAPTDARFTGWIERRVLTTTAVCYDFRIDEHLTDDLAAQRARLRLLLRAARGGPGSPASASS